MTTDMVLAKLDGEAGDGSLPCPPKLYVGWRESDVVRIDRRGASDREGWHACLQTAKNKNNIVQVAAFALWCHLPHHTVTAGTIMPL